MNTFDWYVRVKLVIFLVACVVGSCLSCYALTDMILTAIKGK